MKTKTFYISFILIINALTGQNWEPFPNESVYYEPGEESLRHFYLPLTKVNNSDTFRVVNPLLASSLIGSYSYSNQFLSIFPYNELYDFTYEVFDNWSMMEVDPGYWLKTYNKTNSKIELITEQNNILPLNFNGTDTFSLANMDLISNTFVSKLDSTYTTGSDSIKIFGFYLLPDMVKLENSKVILSKNNGIIQMPIPSFFPYCVPLSFVGKTEDIYPYSSNRTHQMFKHNPGDEVQSYYKKEVNSLLTTEFKKVIYVNQEYDSINKKYINETDVWKLKTQNHLTNGYSILNQSYTVSQNDTISNVSNEKEINYGLPYYLNSSGHFINYKETNNWEPTIINPGIESRTIGKPQQDLGYYYQISYPTEDWIERKTYYTMLNGIENGTPNNIAFFLNTPMAKDQIQYSLTNQEIKITNPENFKSGRIYSIKGQFIKYLNKQELETSINIEFYKNVHVLVLISKDSNNKHFIKFSNSN